MPTLDLPALYGFVMLGCIGVCIQLTAIGFKAMYIRQKVFTKEFFEKNFPTELKEEKIDLRFGYPDVGSGFYSQKLTHDEWKTINNAQRGHINYMETALPIIIFMLVSGLSFTYLTLFFQALYLIARWLYATGYSVGGPKARYKPVLFIYICFLGLGGLAAASSIKIGLGL